MTLPVASDADQKNGGHAEAPRQGKSDMLSVAEKAPKASLLQKVGSEFITQSPEKRAAMWLEEKVSKSQDKITTFAADLTPAIATVLLARNEGNRSIKNVVVEKYARDMAHGAWAFNGEPLIIAKDGSMNDGQHRCLAVIDAQTAIPVIFVVGVERETRTTVNQGVVRTVADFLSMNGHTNTTQLAAAAACVWQHQQWGYLSNNGRNKPTKGESIALIESHPNIMKSVNLVNVPGAAVIGKPVLAFCHWTFARATSDKIAEEFITSITTGAGLAVSHPILYARNRLINERGKLRLNDKAEILIRAWNIWRKGGAITRSFPVLGGKLPTVEA